VRINLAAVATCGADAVRTIGLAISAAAFGAAEASRRILLSLFLSAVGAASLAAIKILATCALAIEVMATGAGSLVRQVGLVIGATSTVRAFVRWLGNRFWKLVTYTVQPEDREFRTEEEQTLMIEPEIDAEFRVEEERHIVVAPDHDEINVGGQMSYQVVKDPVAVLPYTFNWGDWLGDATITNSTWTPPENSDLVVEDQDVDLAKKKTVVWLSGGTVGSTYRVKNEITASDGRDDARSLMVLVRHR
jgi:hypothetical protein